MSNRVRGIWGNLTLAVASVVLAGTSLVRAQDAGQPLDDATAAQDASSEGATQDATAAPAVQADPPSRAVRISLLNGAVSMEPAGGTQFVAAELNGVLTSGDRIYTDASATAELQTGQVALRAGGNADLTVTAMTDQVAQFGLAAGSVHLRSFAIPAGTVLELDTPEAAVTVLQAGDVRVDEDATGHTTTISVIAGDAQVDGPGLSQTLHPGDRLEVHGGDPALGQPAYAEPLPPVPADALDGISDQRDSLYANGQEGSASYLNADTTGGADLAQYGSWDAEAEVGPVWYPVVAVGWRPYCYGHWRYVAPWGWTWVGNEPWAFAPSHYGRWVFLGNRWGWVPGIPALRPVYAPGLVAFVGGARFSATLNPASATGVTAWFPLGPGEPYAPWYHGSTGYLNRVNASNLFSRNTAEAEAIYHQRAVNVYGNTAARTFANRTLDTVAVAETSFAAGRPVDAHRLRIPADQLAQAPLLTRPTAEPVRAAGVAALPRPTAMHIDRQGGAGPEAVRVATVPTQAQRPAFVQAPHLPEGAGGIEARRGTELFPARPVTGTPRGIDAQHGGRPAPPPVARPAANAPAARPAPEPARPAPATSVPRK